jgi:hypothetical protein
VGRAAVKSVGVESWREGMGLGGLRDQLAGMIVWGKLDRWQSGGEASFHQQPVNATRDIALIKMTTEGLEYPVIRRVIRS